MAEEVKFKKNRKKLPNVILLPLFLVVLGSICAFLLSLTNELTKKPIEENSALAAANELKEIKNLLTDEYGLVDVNNVNDSTDNIKTSNISDAEVPDPFKESTDLMYGNVELLKGRGDDYCNYEVAAVFYCLDKDQAPYLAFKVLHTNNFTTVTTIVVVSLDNNMENIKIEHVKVIGKATTLGTAKDNMFTGKDDEWGVSGKTKDNYKSDFTIIAGSTYSSKSVKNSIMYAFKQIEEYSSSLSNGLIMEVQNG